MWMHMPLRDQMIDCPHPRSSKFTHVRNVSQACFSGGGEIPFGGQKVAADEMLVSGKLSMHGIEYHVKDVIN